MRLKCLKNTEKVFIIIITKTWRLKMKNIICMLLAILMLLSLAACGENAEDNVNDTESVMLTDTDPIISPESESDTETKETESSVSETEPLYPYDTSVPVNSISFSVKTPITYPRYEEPGYDYFGAQHLQGFCVDDALEYMYFSLTGMIVKVDMKTGEEAGKFIASRSLQSKGFHLGDVTYHDGYLYSSATFWGSDKTYIAVIKASDINGTVDETKSDFKDENTIIYGLLTPNCLPENKLEDSGDWRYQSRGYDGITVGTIPGKGCIKADGTIINDDKTYLLSCLTTSLTDVLRYDDDNKQIMAFDFDNITDENLLPLTGERVALKEETAVLGYTYRMFVYAGDHEYSVQTLEADKDTGDLIMICYKRAAANEFPAETTFVVDGSKMLYVDEIEIGQSVPKTSPDYDLARIKAYEYTDIDDIDEDGDTDEKPTGWHMTLKCICGKGDIEKHEPLSFGETGVEFHYCGASFGSSNGIVSVGNGYYYNASQANNKPTDENGNPKNYTDRADTAITEYGARGTLNFLNKSGKWSFVNVE